MRTRGIIILMLVAVFGLSACVAPPPRERVVYRDTASHGYAQGDYREDPRYYESQSGYDQRGHCYTCGTIRTIDQIEIRQQTTGGGAILGAIIGGLVGNQFGRGSGRAATTAVGAVGGAVVGNSVEQNNARAASGYAWRYFVELDDGRTATVTQYDNQGYRVGDRVLVRGGRGNGHLEPIR